MNDDTKQVAVPGEPPKAPAPKFKTREEWLNAAADKFQNLFETKGGQKMPFTHISCGWPSIMGLSLKGKRRIGEAWSGACSDDGKPHIFISPYLKDVLDINKDDGCGVLPTLVHEMVHTTVGLEAGHGKVFKKFAVAVGLEGKMTSTHAGAELRELCKKVAEELGTYPHSGLDFTVQQKLRKKQTTRMVKCECAECGYVLRTSRKWIDVGIPRCPAGHGVMTVEAKTEEPDGDE